MQQFETIYPKAKVFYTARDNQVLFFHDGIGTIAELAQTDYFEHLLCYYTFSWYFSKESAQKLERILNKAARSTSWENLRKRLRFLMNSKEELEQIRNILPDEMSVHFNNASLINEAKYPHAPGASKTFDAIYNARPNLFKRHELTAAVKNKAFLAYQWKVVDVDLREYAPMEIFQDVDGSEVWKHLSMARVGLMLSEMEGACYASLEYLLCGLPVVSTPSKGGRDVYYTEANSIICEPDPAAVAEAVDIAVRKLASGEFEPEAISRAAHWRMRDFRTTLQENIAASLLDLDGSSLPEGYLDCALGQTNKLWKFRNMRVKSLLSLQ